MREKPVGENSANNTDTAAKKNRLRGLAAAGLAFLLSANLAACASGPSEEKVSQFHTDYAAAQEAYDGTTMNLDGTKSNWAEVSNNVQSAEAYVQQAIKLVEEATGQTFDVTAATAAGVADEQQAAASQAIIDALKASSEIGVTADASPDVIYVALEKAAKSRQLAEEAAGFAAVFKAVSEAKTTESDKPDSNELEPTDRPSKPGDEKLTDKDIETAEVVLNKSQEDYEKSLALLGESETARQSTAANSATAAEFLAGLEAKTGGNVIAATNGEIGYNVYYQDENGTLSLDPVDGARQKVAFRADKLSDGVDNFSNALTYLYGDGSVAQVPLMFAFESKSDPKDQYGLSGDGVTVGSLAFSANGVSDVLREEEYLTKAKELGLPTYRGLITYTDVSTEDFVYATVEAYGLDRDDTVWQADYGTMLEASGLIK
jgi:hypothetical protein